MHDRSRTKQELSEEISVLKQQMETSEAEYKRTNAVPRMSGELYTKIVQTIPDIIVHMNLNGEIFFINDVGLRLGGFQKKELIGQNMYSFIAPEDQEKAARNTALMFERKLGPQEYHLFNKDGRKLLFEVNGDILRNEDGSPYGIIHICRDITERRRVEDETAILAKIGRLISSTLNIDAVYERFSAEVHKLIPFDRIHVNLKDPDGETFTIAYVSGIDIAGRRAGDKVPLAGSISEALYRTKRSLLLHPVSEDEIAGRFPSASAATTFRAGMNSILAAPLISGDEVIGILHFRSKKPNAYTEQDLHLAERIGLQISGAIANAQIFNSLSKTERELRESEEKLRILFNNDLTAIYIFELETLRLLDVNDAFVRLYGYSREELLCGMRLLEISAEPEESASAVRSAFEKDAIFIPLRWHRKKDGTVFPVEIVGGGYVWKDRRVMYGIARDITERRQTEQVLKETLDQLESRVRERTIELEETNIALRVLLKKGEKDQKTLEENLQSNINQLVTPFLSRLRASQSNPERMTYLNILETNLDNILSPFINRLSAAYKNLTPKEIQIAEMVKQGKKSKEIAELFGISVGTVITHRNNIRKKLDLKSRDANLRSHLLSLV